MLIKLSLKIGAILGVLLGVILLIPFINGVSCFILYTSVGVAVVYYLKKRNLVGFLSYQDGALIGAVSGFISLITAAVVYLPVSYFLGILFNPISKAGSALFSSLIVASYSMFVLTMIVIFMALLSALFNAFSGLITTYVYGITEQKPTEEETDFIIE